MGQTKKPSPIKYHLGAAVLLAMAVALNVFNLSGQSPTVDEYAHVPAGYSYLVTGDFRLYPQNPPLIKMFLALPMTAMDLSFPHKAWLDSKSAWGPWYFADKFTEANPEKRLNIYVWARIMNLSLSFILGLVVYLWTIELYGHRPALAATAFTATSPTLLAHAGIATVDMGFTLFFILALYAFFRVFQSRSCTRIVTTGVVFGAAMASKFTALVLVPIFFLTAAVMIAVNAGRRKGAQAAGKPSMSRKIINEAVCLALIFLIGLAVIHAAYFFRGGVNYIEEAAVVSRTGKYLSQSVSGRVPVPLPFDYIRGMDLQLWDVEQGEFPNYLNSRWRRNGSPYYFLEALTLKETIPGLIFIVLGTAVVLYRMKNGKHHPSGGSRIPSWPFVHLPATIFFLMISLCGNLQLGVRYAMPVLPLAFIAASQMLKGKSHLKAGSMALPVVVMALFAWQCLETGTAAPHYLSYFNQIAGGSRGGARYLLDSNIDWGQDLPSLSKWMKQNQVDELGLLYFGHADPGWYGINWHLPDPADEYTAISVNFLHGYPYALTYLAPWEKRPPAITDPELIKFRRLAFLLKDKKPHHVAGGSIYIISLNNN